MCVSHICCALITGSLILVIELWYDKKNNNNLLKQQFESHSQCEQESTCQSLFPALCQKKKKREEKSLTVVRELLS